MKSTELNFEDLFVIENKQKNIYDMIIRKLRFKLEETVPKINIIKGETIWVEHETKPHMIL